MFAHLNARSAGGLKLFVSVVIDGLVRGKFKKMSLCCAKFILIFVCLSVLVFIFLIIYFLFFRRVVMKILVRGVIQLLHVCRRAFCMRL